LTLPRASAASQTPSIPEIAPGTLHVWRVESSGVDADVGVLSAHERVRASRLHFERDRVRFIAVHHALREVLSRYVGTSPAALRLDTETNGKPYLGDRGDLSFNLSYSEDVAYIAIRRSGAVGIDVERPQVVPDLDAVAARVLSTEERAELTGLYGTSRNAAFLCAWTRKEAFVKALGLGIIDDLRSITVGVTNEDRVVPPVNGVSSEAVHVRTLASGMGEHVALACVGGRDQLMCFHYGPALRECRRIPPAALNTASSVSAVFDSVTNCVADGFASSLDMYAHT
jgi:4'-phosphopantetheinyl transferase